MFAVRSVRFLVVAMVLAMFGGCFYNTAHAVSIQFGAAPIIIGANLPAGRTVLPFGPQANPGGLAWDATAGSVILDLVAGPGATTLAARLTLTGTPGADGQFGTADDIPLDIVYDPVGGAGNAVTITFSSAPPVPSFNPIVAPVFDSADLNGTVFSANALAAGVQLEARAFGAGAFGVVGPFAGPGIFGGAIGPILEPAPPVTGLTGILTFTFDGVNQAAGDFVRLPHSASVTAVTPEPSTITLFGLGAIGLFGYGWRRRKR